MSIQVIYYILLFVVFISSISLFTVLLTNKTVSQIKFKRNRISEMKSKVKNKLDNKDIDTVFYCSGLDITGYTYILTRIIIFGFWVGLLIITYVLQRQISPFQLILCVIIFLATSPKLTFAGYSTPFAIMTKLLTNEYREKKNREIYLAICQLKNIATFNMSKIGSDYILEHLMKFTNHTKPVFSKMLKMWYEYDVEKACDYFANAIDTEEGRNLADIFRKLDNLSPSELKEQLDLYQSSFVNARQTAKERKSENRGYALYAFVIISAFSVLINFIVIILTSSLLPLKTL